MSCFSEIEKQMKEGDVLKLDQSNDEYSYGVILVANIIRNQENIYGYILEEKEFKSVFPRIKFYLGFHACYFQAQYDPEGQQFVSSIMTKNVNGEDSILKGLSGNADNFMDSMIELEERIIAMMQSSAVLQKVRL